MNHLFALTPLVLLILLLSPFPTHAADQTENIDAMLDIFDAEDPAPVEDQDLQSSLENSSGNENDILQFSGELSLFAAFPVNDSRKQGQGDFRGVSRLRTSLKLDMDIRPEAAWQAHAGIRASYDALPSLKGRDKFSEEYLDDSESELELHEAYVMGSPSSSLDIKVGRQIVAWGTSESLRVIDVLNPMDKREPGQTDIEDLRLPVFMTRADYYPDTTWGITAVVVNETRFDKEPPWGSDFYPANRQLPQSDEPDFSLENQEAALALTGRFTGWDMTLNAAWVLDDTPYYSDNTAKHARIGMVGGTLQVAEGNWLFKGETALFSGKRFTAAPDREYCQGDVLLGAEYSGFEETTITAEILNRHIFGLDRNVAGQSATLRQNDTTIGLRITRDYMNDTLHLLAAGNIALPMNRGGLGRAEVSYDLTDDLTVRTGYAFYLGGDNPIQESLDRNDRFFSEITFSF